MPSSCPTCQQRFAETEGFCPFDGAPLAADAPSAMRALSAHDDHGAALAALQQQPSRGDVYAKLIGTTLDGRYHIERKIGEGGMGVVYAARHVVIEKPVAIKVLKNEVARDPATVKRFVQEAKAASRIGHPNIVDVTDFGTTPGGLTYSVMEYVEGITLAAAIKQGAPFALARSLPIVAQIARALGAAHDKGIVHRDLKPENVFLLARDGRTDFVKIVDFGIAKVMPLEGRSDDGPRLTRAGAVFGTPEYMAPEQAAGRNDTDQRVDIYALGTILYELACGRVPHKAETTMRTLAMQMLDPIMPPSVRRPDLGLAADFEQVVMKALAKKRDERYTTMRELLVDLERVAGGVPLEQPVSASASVRNHGPSGLHAAATGPVVSKTAAAGLTLTPTPPGADPTARNAARTTMRPPAAVPAKEGVPIADATVADSGGDMFFEPTEVRRAPRPRPRWPLLALGFVGLAGIGVAIGLIATRRDGDDAALGGDPSGDAGAVAVAAIAPLDGGAAAGDAASPARDAAVVASAGAPDAGVRGGRGDAGRAAPHAPHADAGAADDPGVPGQELEIQVITKPEGAAIYSGSTYRGTGGVTLREQEGTTLALRCTMPGYRAGQVTVRFDGATEIYMCKLTREKKCLPGLKNPFDDCPDPPTPTP